MELLPFTIYYFNSKGFWLNVALHKRNEKTLIALMIIFSIFFLLLNFSIRENYAYHWKELAKEIYADKVLRFNQEKVGTKSLSYRRFLRLENNIILFYFHASKTKGIYKLFDIVYNDEKNYHLITASEVTVKKNRLFMKNGYVHDLSKTSIDTEKFVKKTIALPNSIKDYLSLSHKLHNIPTVYLKKTLGINRDLRTESIAYIKALYLYRFIPFILSICLALVLFKLSFHFYIQYNFKYFLYHAISNLIFLTLFSYLGVYWMIDS